MLMRLNNGLPELKPLCLEARLCQISRFLSHRLVKYGPLATMQFPSDTLAQANELFIVACLVGRHRKVRDPIEHLQLVAALGILVDFFRFHHGWRRCRNRPAR